MKEEEIRSQKLFDDYLCLAEEDARTFFSNVPRSRIPCPGCEGEGQKVFSKNGFDFEECPDCLTLFVNPRPPADAFSKYYRESKSSRLWATRFYKDTEEARREKLWKPKARMIKDALARYRVSGFSVLDIGGGYGLFAEEFKAISDQPIIVIEPAPHLAEICREKRLDVIEEFMEDVKRADLPEGGKVFVSFELFGHLQDPKEFIRYLKSLMTSGDIFLLTTLSGTGVDIQALWEDSKSVPPPHPLNFLNPHSVRLLLERVGMKVLELTTPGKLDIDILCNNSDNIKDRFWRNFVKQATEGQRQQAQEWVASSGWSSHMMVISRKP